MSQNDSDDLDARLEQLSHQISEAANQARHRTSSRLCAEARRLARMEKQLEPYLHALYQFGESIDEFSPREGIEASIELIALLENEDRARAFQADFDLDQYEYTRSWMLPRVYKQLATSTAHTSGYNSPGMHQCITDGLEVCRKLGDRNAMILFREFAVEVYRSADDIDMALHFARESLNMQGADQISRRVASADDVATLLALQGHLPAAVDAVQFGWPLCEEFFNPYNAHLNYVPMARQILSLAGRTDILAGFPKVVDAGENVPDGVTPIQLPSREESWQFAYIYDESMFVEECCQGDYEAALNRMKPWDKKYRDIECLSDWFEVRLRLIAVHRLLGRFEQLEALARPLREAARKAHDWLTLRRLERILDPAIPATPVALLGDVTIGPFATGGQSPAPSLSPAESSEAAPEEDFQPPAWGERIQQFYARLPEGPEQWVSIVSELLATAPSSITDPQEAATMMHIFRFASRGDQRIAEIWQWANSLKQTFHSHAPVISMLAALGHALRLSYQSGDVNAPSPPLPAGVDLDQLIPIEQLESMFRQSLDLDPENAENYARAGSYHFDHERYGEAERCLARAFRLNRQLSAAAVRLADVYARTDRHKDSLAVLDLAIREGCEDPQLAWRAALGAYSLEQYPAMLTYLDRFEAQAPEEPWVQHHRACALLELERPEEALRAIELEESRNPEAVEANLIQRVSALGQMKREAEFREGLTEILKLRLGAIETLTVQGLARLMERLWKSSPLASDDPLQRDLEDRLLGCGMAPTELLARSRKLSGSREHVKLMQCILRQPLDGTWPDSHQCLPGEEDWISYDTAWNVLARDRDHASELVLKWQARCWPQPAEILEILESDQEFEDLAGVVWQGGRAPSQI